MSSRINKQFLSVSNLHCSGSFETNLTNFQQSWRTVCRKRINSSLKNVPQNLFYKSRSCLLLSNFTFKCLSVCSELSLVKTTSTHFSGLFLFANCCVHHRSLGNKKSKNSYLNRKYVDINGITAYCSSLNQLLQKCKSTKADLLEAEMRVLLQHQNSSYLQISCKLLSLNIVRRVSTNGRFLTGQETRSCHMQLQNSNLDLFRASLHWDFQLHQRQYSQIVWKPKPKLWLSSHVHENGAFQVWDPGKMNSSCLGWVEVVEVAVEKQKKWGGSLLHSMQEIKLKRVLWLGKCYSQHLLWR